MGEWGREIERQTDTDRELMSSVLAYPALSSSQRQWLTKQNPQTVGFGDIVAVNGMETIVMLFIIVLSSASFGLLVGVREMVIRDTDEGGIAFDQYMSGLRRYLKIRKYPGDLEERICTYYSLCKSGRNAFSETEVIADLPNSLKSEIAFYINHVILERVPLFAEFDLPLVKSLSSILFPEVFLRGDFVVKQGNIGEEMYFVNTGVVEVFPDDRRFRVLKSVGDFFGEISLLQKTPRNANVRAITKCNIYVMKWVHYEEVMQYYPDERHSLERKLMPIFERARKLSQAVTDVEIDRQLKAVTEAENEASGRNAVGADQSPGKGGSRRQSVIVESHGRRKTVRVERAMTLISESDHIPEIEPIPTTRLGGLVEGGDDEEEEEGGNKGDHEEERQVVVKGGDGDHDGGDDGSVVEEKERGDDSDGERVGVVATYREGEVEEEEEEKKEKEAAGGEGGGEEQGGTQEEESDSKHEYAQALGTDVTASGQTDREEEVKKDLEKGGATS